MVLPIELSVLAITILVYDVIYTSSSTLWVSILAWILLGAGWGLGIVPIYPDMNEITR